MKFRDEEDERIGFLVTRIMTSNLNARILKLWRLAVCSGFSYLLSITTQSPPEEGF